MSDPTANQGAGWMPSRLQSFYIGLCFGMGAGLALSFAWLR